MVSLHRSAVATAAATFFLLIAGGMVTSTDSGLAVPDWPLSYGTWFPPMVGGIFYEHGHRMVAATVGLMILVLAVWLQRAEPRAWVRQLGYTALGAVVVQGLLGGLTVLLLLPPQISIAHACLGQATFCVVVCLAVATSRGWGAGRTEQYPDKLRAAGTALAVLAVGQLVLGALIRHTGRGLWLHIGGAALLAALAAGWVAVVARRRHDWPALWRHAARLGALVLAQVALGLSVWQLGRWPLLRTAHVATGALVLAQTVLIAWQLRRGSATSRPARSWRVSLGPLIELTKPRLSSLVLTTTAAGYWLADPSWRSPGRFIAALAGTALVAGGANALNEWWERDQDALMHRTRSRPLPSGRVQPRAACWFGLVLVAVGVVALAAWAHPLAAGLAAASAASYVLIYTPLKSRTALCTLVGAVPGALPPVIGWAAARGALGLEAWALFLLLFVWQLPHFLAIAVLYRDDYARGGMRMLPVTEPDGAMTARQTVLYGLVLVPLSLFPSMIGLAGPAYFLGALALSTAFLAAALRAAVAPSTPNARWLFRSSIAYLPLVLLLLVGDRAAAMAMQSAAARPASPSAVALPVFGVLPDFTLTDHEGRSVSRQGLQGRVWIADFVFTRCAGQCPMMHQRMQALDRGFEQERGLMLLSFSADPGYDTPETLAAFARRAGLGGPRWRFVTGSPAAITTLALKGFRLSMAEGGPPEEPVTHSTRLVLVDHRGRIRGYYDAESAEAMRRLEVDVRAALQEGARDGA